jgi:hypothetical protein
MDKIKDLIRVYDDALESNICEFLINTFEQNSDKHERIDNEKKPNFTQFNLTKYHELSEDTIKVHNYLIQKTLKYKDDYYKFVDPRVFPEQHALEQFRIKKYNPDGLDQFDTHVDVLTHDSAKRFLSFLWYLNDVDDGGNTVFKEIIIKPKTGTLIIFPPMWMYPHKGEPLVSNSKYIMSTYLHYL